MESAGFTVDSLQYTAKYISEAGGTSVETYILKEKKISVIEKQVVKGVRKYGEIRPEQEDKMPWQMKKSYSLSRNNTGPDERRDEEEVADRNCCALTMADPCYHPCSPI